MARIDEGPALIRLERALQKARDDFFREVSHLSEGDAIELAAGAFDSELEGMNMRIDELQDEVEED